jgi:hypothetical protein
MTEIRCGDWGHDIPCGDNQFVSAVAKSAYNDKHVNKKNICVQCSPLDDRLNSGSITNKTATRFGET